MSRLLSSCTSGSPPGARLTLCMPLWLKTIILFKSQPKCYCLNQMSNINKTPLVFVCLFQASLLSAWQIFLLHKWKHALQSQNGYCLSRLAYWTRIFSMNGENGDNMLQQPKVRHFYMTVTHLCHLDHSHLFMHYNRIFGFLRWDEQAQRFSCMIINTC